MQKEVDNSILRIIDANLNRAKEGLRVCEDVCRFVLNNEEDTLGFKIIRHQLGEICLSIGIGKIINARDIESDVGVQSTSSELQRNNIQNIFFANAQRVKESIRVLEELYKLIDRDTAKEIKSLRYRFYALEKRIAQHI